MPKALTDEQVSAEVDALLGEFGVLGEADDFDADEAPARESPVSEKTAPSADTDALWGSRPKPK